MNQDISRRTAITSTLAWAGAAVVLTKPGRANAYAAANERPSVAAIGTGSRWYQRATGLEGRYGSAPEFRKYGDYVAVCDADNMRQTLAADIVKEWTGQMPTVHSDYRAILDDDRIDIVHISTPDHWHAKIAIEAMLAGKDVYCEKPMTLTIEEGRLMSKVCRDTKRVVQIGTQQRSGKDFVQAIAMIREGRIGEVKRAVCSIGGAPTSPTIPQVDPPKNLDWNLWLGPAPFVNYRSKPGNSNETKNWSRSHYEFRWWYEYSGGKLTDWGAHHVDIATWGLDKIATGPVSVDPIMVKHPVRFEDGHPTDNSQYNTATEFQILAKFEDGKEIEIRHDGRNGILFEGTKGRLFVNRGSISGKSVEELASNPLPDGALEKAYKGRSLTNHFENFFDAVVSRKEPISDVHSHHRALSTCHLAGIAARVGRKIAWDPVAEKVVGDDTAQQLVGRENRRGFEIEM